MSFYPRAGDGESFRPFFQSSQISVGRQSCRTGASAQAPRGSKDRTRSALCEDTTMLIDY